MSCSAKDLIRLAMHAAPGERPCASALLGHPWLTVDADRGSAAEGGGVGGGEADGAHWSPISVGSLAAALPQL